MPDGCVCSRIAIFQRNGTKILLIMYVGVYISNGYIAHIVFYLFIVL